MERQAITGEDLNLPFSMFELRKAISSARQTTTGKDGVGSMMLDHMKDSTLAVVLRLFNLVWETSNIPSTWKQSVIVPVLKPGKDLSDLSSYRPIALTSQSGKTMERMVTQRLTQQKSALSISKWIL